MELGLRPGAYNNIASFGIADSPFQVRIQGSADVSKVRCYGPGLEPNKVRASVPVTFFADTSQAGNAPIEVRQ